MTTRASDKLQRIEKALKTLAREVPVINLQGKDVAERVEFICANVALQEKMKQPEMRELPEIRELREERPS